MDGSQLCQVVDQTPPFVGPFHSLKTTYLARVAETEDVRREAYRLRYRSYISRNYISENPYGMFEDLYDQLPNTRTIIIYKNDCAVGSVRVCWLQRGQGTRSPARDAYPDVIGNLLNECQSDRGYDAIEVNRLVRAPEAENDQGLVFMLLRLAGRLGLAEGFQVIISCVRAHHLPFYRRMRFQEMGPPLPYPGLTCPMSLLKLTKANWDITRASFRLLDPDAGPPGHLDGLEYGHTVYPQLIR